MSPRAPKIPDKLPACLTESFGDTGPASEGPPRTDKFALISVKVAR